MAAELTITRHGPAETLQMRDEILPVYAAAQAEQSHSPFYSPQRFWERLEQLYAPGRDFELVAGRVEGVLVGYAFGSPRDNSTDVWEAVRQRLPAIPVPTAPEPIFIFREFQVHPDHQRRGYGRKLHDALLGARPERLAHLLVRPDNVPARTAYFSWGWQQLGTQQPFPDSPVFDQLVRRLPLSAPGIGDDA